VLRIALDCKRRQERKDGTTAREIQAHQRQWENIVIDWNDLNSHERGKEL